MQISDFYYSDVSILSTDTIEYTHRGESVIDIAPDRKFFREKSFGAPGRIGDCNKSGFFPFGLIEGFSHIVCIEIACEQSRFCESSIEEERQDFHIPINTGDPNPIISFGADDSCDRIPMVAQDRKSTRLNSSHVAISYAV